jgi:hypothetical protein
MGTAQRRGFHTDARDAIREAFKSAANRRWLRAYLDLPNCFAFAVDDAEVFFEHASEEFLTPISQNEQSTLDHKISVLRKNEEKADTVFVSLISFEPRDVAAERP